MLLRGMILASLAWAFCPRMGAAERNGPASRGVLNDWLGRQFASATNWDVGGQFRLRYEVKENAGSFPSRDFIRRGQDNSNDELAFRGKFHVGYSPCRWITMYAEGRDSRVLFDQREPSPDEDEFDLHQAFVAVGDTQRFPVSLKLGRQELNYGDERFIGASDWSNTGRVFDAAKVRFEQSVFWIDAFVGRVVIPYDGRFNVANDYDLFSGVYASSKVIPWQETQLYFLARNVAGRSPNAIAPGLGGPTARDIYTPGMRLRSLPGRLGAWDYAVEIAGQFGSINSGQGRLDQTGLAGYALAGYSFADLWGAPRLALDYSYGSGDSDPSDNRIETFDPLFGTNHKFYGLMDLFGLRNTHNPGVSLSVKPSKQLSLRADYLMFWLADTHDFLYPESGPGRSANGYGRNPTFHSFIGSELDVLASYAPVAWAELQCGYGHFFVGDYVRQSVESVPANGGAVDANWVYVQLKLTF
jgi:hypothetical protein